jgi:hypothetical protein
VKIWLGLIVVLISTIAHSKCVDAIIGQKTWHSQKGYYEHGQFREYNGNNYLIGCVTDEDTVFAVFENSYYDPSVLVARSYKDYDFSPYITPYVVVGVVAGYKDHLTVHVGPLAPYGFVGVDIHPASNKYGIMIDTIGVITSIGVRVSF